MVDYTSDLAGFVSRSLRPGWRFIPCRRGALHYYQFPRGSRGILALAKFGAEIRRRKLGCGRSLP
jgi:hypothetical protein